jgi:hypothetical protein
MSAASFSSSATRPSAVRIMASRRLPCPGCRVKGEIVAAAGIEACQAACRNRLAANVERWVTAAARSGSASNDCADISSRRASARSSAAFWSSSTAEMTWNVGLERKPVQHGFAEGVNGLDLEPARRFEGGGEQPAGEDQLVAAQSRALRARQAFLPAPDRREGPSRQVCLNTRLDISAAAALV